MSATTTTTDPTTDRRLDEPGDHDRFAHYVLKSAIADAAVNGTPTVALCGKVWVPNRTPDGFTVCPRCKEIYDDKRKAEGRS